MLMSAAMESAGRMGARYDSCDATRRELHARTRNLFNREWEADAASDATIDLDDAEPHIVVEGDVAAMYYGGVRMYDLELVSALRTDDRMYTCRGDIFPNEDVIKLYKEVARVVDDRELCFPGTYGCSVNYTGMLHAQCIADDVVPYYYTAESPLRGFVDFDMLLPRGESSQRRVIIVNVAKNGPLLAEQAVIPYGSIIYLAGRHGVQDQQSFANRFARCDQCCAHKRLVHRSTLPVFERAASTLRSQGEKSALRCAIRGGALPRESVGRVAHSREMARVEMRM